MTLNLVGRYVYRSLMRHRRRTALAVIGIGVGCALSMCLVGLIRGEGEMMQRAAADSGNGYLRICPTDWLAARDERLRLPDWQATRERALGIAGVTAVAPHARGEGLLAMGTRTAGVILTGVDPAVEPTINRLVRQVTRGDYLAPDSHHEVVIGVALAERLDVDLGHELLITASGEGGEIRSALLRVRGLVATGSRELDGSVCHVTLADLEEITGYPGAAELSILLDDPVRMPAVQAALEAALPEGQSVIGWQVIVPQLAAGVQMDRVSAAVQVTVVGIIVFLGIASAQLAAVLERRREFAVLAAVGTSSTRLVLVMLLEGLVLGLAGGIAALVLGVPGLWYLATRGLDFTGLYGEADMGIANILVDPIIYADIGWWVLALAFGLSFAATLLSSLYPAWFAVRTDPANALRVDN